ncbi:hypothetical protein PRZ48_008348 [Zasmidium cellare]|uniref:Uncharacterized protein n=1 Tax=Zasmidium cellare TaxID=395010 RepID=A0ABR0EF82_ZASCE|nr:hypothetical protein PRZ48_008348 [Zasmidium cellare]
MQTFLSLLTSFLLATVTFASPIFPARPIRKDLKDLGHSVGSVVEDSVTSPEEPESYNKPASSGWAAPSTWKGDKEWHATGKTPAPSAHLPEHTASQWHATGFAAPSAHFPEHAPKGTGVPHKIPVVKPENGSFPAHTAPHFSHGTAYSHSIELSTGFVPQATGFPHKKLQVNSTVGVWPSGAALSSGAFRPSGAAWPSVKTTFSLSTGALAVPTGSKPDFKINATSVQPFATGTAFSTPKLFSTGTAFTVEVPSGTAPSIKSANVTTPAVGFQTAPTSILLSTAALPRMPSNATTAPELLTATPSSIALSTGAVPAVPAPGVPSNATTAFELLTASSPSVVLATAPTSIAIANTTLSSLAFPTAPSSPVILATAPTSHLLIPTAHSSSIVLATAPSSLALVNSTSIPIQLATASSPSIVLSTAAVSSPSAQLIAPHFSTGSLPISKSIALETAPASDFHPKISASSIVINTASIGLPSAKAPAPTGEVPHAKESIAAPSGTAPSPHYEAAHKTGEVSHPTEHAPSVTSHSYIHIATAPAEVSLASETPSSTTTWTESTAAPSAAAPSAPAYQHSAETKEVVHKSPGAPCSPDEKLQCKGESMYGSCQFNDGHWRWYWTDVKDGHVCKDGAVQKDSYGWSSSSWGSSGNSW